MAKKYRLGIIGCGKVAEKYLKAVHHNNTIVELVAIADTRSDAMLRLLGHSKLSSRAAASVALYEDYRLMLEEMPLDIVAVTTPSGTHAEIGLEVLRRKIHLMAEKPMALSLSDCHLLIHTAQEQDVKIVLGHIYRYFPLVQSLAGDIAKGQFGNVLHGSVQVHWGHDQSYYDQAAWRGTWAQDGGVLMNQSIHALDLLFFLMGSHVTEAVAMIARQTHSMEAEDLALGLLRLENGSYCSVEGTTSTRPSDPRAGFTILFSHGSIRAGIRSGKPYFDIRGKANRKLNGRYLRRFISETMRCQGIRGFIRAFHPHSGILRDFCLSITNDTVPLADGISGKQAVEAVLAMYRSAKTGCRVRLPLEESASLDEMTGFFGS